MDSKLANSFAKLQTQIDHRSLSETIHDQILIELVQRHSHLGFHKMKRFCRLADWQAWLSRQAGWRSFMDHDHEDSPDKVNDICWYFDLKEGPLRLSLSMELPPCTFRPLNHQEACQLTSAMDRPPPQCSGEEVSEKMYTIAELLMDGRTDRNPYNSQKGVGFRTGFL